MTETLSILMVYELGPTDNGHWVGGVESHIYYLCKHLIDKGHHVTFLTGGIPENKEKILFEGLNIERVDFRKFIRRTWDPYNLLFSRQLLFPVPAVQRALQLKTRFDVVHGHIYTSSIVAALFGRIRGCGKISTIHGSYYDVWYQIRQNKLKATLYKTAERVIAPFINLLSDVQIHTDRAFAEKLLKWGANKSKTHVIENGVDINHYNPNNVNVPILRGDLPIIMAVRRLVPKNGIEYLLRAVPYVLKEINARFVIIGDGPERHNLERLTRTLGITHATTFMGGRPHKEIPKYLASADIVVVPSLVEATSIAMMEAMAMEKSVVASDIPGLRELSDNGNVAELVPPKNPLSIAKSIITLLSDEKRRNTLGCNGRAFIVSTKSWKSVAEKTIALYRKTISN